MHLQINGESVDYPDGISVEELIAFCKIAPEQVAVLVNGDVILKTQRSAHRLHDGDLVELLTCAPGG